MMQIVDCGFRIDERHKAQGTRRKEESAALIIRIPEGASFACDRRIYELRDCGLGRAGGRGKDSWQEADGSGQNKDGGKIANCEFGIEVLRD
jgi:hypothetical protein